MMAILFSVLFFACALRAWAQPNNRTDHHVHLQDSETVQLGFRMLAAFHEKPKHIDSLVLNADTIIGRLDKAQFKSAWILSNAYWFGSPLTPVNNEYAQVKRENDWIATEAERYPTRLKAFMSVNPLKPYALEEIKRCAESKRFAGLKMHFANSKVNLLRQADVKQLQQVFAAVDKYHLLVLVHFRSAQKWSGIKNTTVLLNELMPFATHSKVVIAHMAGWGGYDRQTNAALNLIAQWLNKSNANRQNLYLETSAVFPLDLNEEGQAKNKKDNWKPIPHLKQRIAEIGAHNILFGTDWPLIDMGPYVNLLEKNLGKPVIEQILANASPALH